ncbi:hypothetical protein B5M10_02965 [Pluralibacter gergoviae]|uniref:hypothetical protein n=1 Tax=Pluralibacter gergoviae TaxID=61647 RepID=UPI0005ECF916|nr:hypothetical protein [Pluralibacter gergoviae]KJM58553.1 hypothetical protein SS31_20615 [Pluralibacter gergoviae]OUR04196.1 hypothetical protein B5M10_02965 [Pluralibacter gergoviae]
MTDFKEMRAAALLAQSAAEKYADGEINPTEFARQCSEFNSLTDSPEQILALLDELEGAIAHVALLKIDRRELIKEASERSITIEPLRSFVTDADLAALHRFVECCDDPDSGGHDLKKEQVRRLEKIGALQRSGRISYTTDFGDLLISITDGIQTQGGE